MASPALGGQPTQRRQELVAQQSIPPSVQQRDQAAAIAENIWEATLAPAASSGLFRSIVPNTHGFSLPWLESE